MLTRQQIARNLAGVAAALAALKDNTPATDADRSRHRQLVAEEMARAEARRAKAAGLFGGA